MKSKVLIVDDEKDICFLISEILNDENYITSSAYNSKQALEEFNLFNPDLIILDVWLGNSDLDGIELLKEFKKFNPSIPIIIVSGHGTVDMAVNAIKNGAYDFLEKPFNSDKIIVLTNRAIQSANLIKENKILRKITEPDTTLVGNSIFINELKKTLEKISLSGSRIIISGPIGSGKNLIAQTIHKLSKRNNSLANIIDFSSIDQVQLDSLFKEDINNLNNNIFVKSNNGTLIFQDIDKISIEYQKKILTFLDNQGLFKNLNLNFNIKLISITSKNIIEEIKNGNFRKDLFNRLNVIPIKVPPITSRREDILPLSIHYLKKFNKNKKYKLFFSKLAISKLESYDWPGNVRQILNYMERIVILNQNKNLYKDYEISDLPKDMGENDDYNIKPFNVLGLNLKEAREQFEKEYLLSQINRFNGNISKVSDFTGMERTALYRKLKSLNIDLEKK